MLNRYHLRKILTM